MTGFFLFFCDTRRFYLNEFKELQIKPMKFINIENSNSKECILKKIVH